MRTLILFLTVCFFAIQPGSATTPKAPQKTHAIAMHGDIKQPKDFKHFPGVNPKAPKGGTLKLGVVGTFDSTNPYIIKGTSPVGLSLFSEKLVYEGLMKRASDEPFTLYAWIAESVEMAPDRSWIVFHLNPKAKWADGKPITPKDVIFTYETLKAKGSHNVRTTYKKVNAVKQVGPFSIKFTFNTQEDGAYNPELPLIIAMMSVLPSHFFEGKDFEKMALDFVMGSGPYKIKDIKPGHSIVYERRKDYWGQGLPFSVGIHNFDKIELEYYRERNVSVLAFESGEYDYLGVIQSARQHDFKERSFADPTLKIIDYKHSRPVSVATYCMNSRRDLFKDARVREALSYAFDFHWLNKNLFHGKYARTRSFFENTELAHKGVPSKDELALLEQFKNELPVEVFQEPYYPSNYKGELKMRDGLKIAKDLLKQAGWEIQKGILRNVQTGKVFDFELMLYSKSDEKVALDFARNLKKLGITMGIRTLDPAQYETRRLKFDYDMIVQNMYSGNSPGAELYFYWGAEMADKEGSRNYAGVKSNAVDYLTKYIASAKTRSDLVTGCHALDRVLMWGHYVIPLYYNNRIFITYRDKLGHPEIDPNLPLLLSHWWANPEKENNKKKKVT